MQKKDCIENFFKTFHMTSAELLQVFFIIKYIRNLLNMRQIAYKFSKNINICTTEEFVI